MRFSSVLVLAGLLVAGAGLVSKPLQERLDDGDFAAMADQVDAAVQNARTTLDRNERAIAQARAGWACLGGTGPCPGGGNPFSR